MRQVRTERMDEVGLSSSGFFQPVCFEMFTLQQTFLQTLLEAEFDPLVARKEI